MCCGDQQKAREVLPPQRPSFSSSGVGRARIPRQGVMSRVLPTRATWLLLDGELWCRPCLYDHVGDEVEQHLQGCDAFIANMDGG